MTKQALRRTVGFCAAAWQASARRWLDGALRYVTATPGLAFRDFSFLEEMAMDELAPAPSWQGKADGMILAFGLREDEPADAAMRWIERGGVPAVSLVWDWRHSRLPVVATDFAAVMTCAAEYLIRRHACDGIKVADVVRHLRIARRTLDQHFADRLGHSPAQEIRRVRLDMARKLLAETALSVGRVAELAGFRDLAQFNATFRQHAGLPPAEFRQRERQ
ncbi:MAG: helix-turn-helix domain-containing protein [Verrucomicrobia bacterium]|nr:helix-turn-helix domain-containing protein [Verrucomicrobiota bacterium]